MAKVQQKKILTQRIGKYEPLDLTAYKRLGGLRGLEQALSVGPEGVIEQIKQSGLTGRGGAGFLEALKWEGAAREKKFPKYYICNADEGELGTFKDKVLLDGDPWAVFEGILIGAFAVGAEHAYIYIKSEYEATYELWLALAREAEKAGLLGERILGSNFSVRFHVVRGRGPYIAGEEFALIASLEARRPMSRLKPPYPTDQGLFGKPTVVNNVETVANVPVILAQGAAAFRKLGAENDPGTRLVSLSGDVKRPGVYELEIGSATLREIIAELGEGTTHGRPVKAVQPGGGTSALLAEGSLDCPLTTRALREAGSSLGTAGLIVYEEGKSMLDIVRGLLEFYGAESCGRCAPCRIGVRKMKGIIDQLSAEQGTVDDLSRLRQIGKACTAVSTCGMGQAFPLPILSALELFPQDFTAAVRQTSAKELESKVAE